MYLVPVGPIKHFLEFMGKFMRTPIARIALYAPDRGNIRPISPAYRFVSLMGKSRER